MKRDHSLEEQAAREKCRSITIARAETYTFREHSEEMLISCSRAGSPPKRTVLRARSLEGQVALFLEDR